MRFALKYKKYLIIVILSGAGLLSAPGRQTSAQSSVAFGGKELAAQTQTAPESIAGVPGVAVQREAVNFTELARQRSFAPARQREIKLPPSHKPKSFDRAVRAELIAPNDELAFGPAEAAANDAPSPAPAASFQALDDAGFSIPPDTHGAVGPNHLMVALNTQVRIQRRNGEEVSRVIIEDFWRRLTDSNVFDPRVLYDPFNQRWMFTVVADAQRATSSVLVGVSQTDDPTGNWFLYKVDADETDQAWADFPSMGFNKNWIVIQTNMFGVGSAGDFKGSQIFAFDKADLYAGGAGRFTRLKPPLDVGSNQAPAITYDNNQSALYLLEMLDGEKDGQGFLQVFTITGPVGAEVFTLGPIVSTANTWSNRPAGSSDFAPQLGSNEKIQNNDADFNHVVYRNGSLWAAHTVFLPATGAPTHSGIQWWEIAPETGQIRQRGRIVDPAGNTFYGFPSIAVNRNNDVLIGYSRFSAAQHPSANYSFRAGGDPAGTLRADTVLKAGLAAYVKRFSGAKNRWGDYSATVVDPLNDTDMWTIQEYAETPAAADRWGTWWGRFSLGPVVSDLALTLAGSSTSVSVGRPLTYTLRVTNAGPDLATGVTLTDTLPADASLLTAATTRGACTGTTILTCDLGTLPSGATATVSVVVRANAAGTISSQATVTSNATDPIAGNNSAALSTTVREVIPTVTRLSPGGVPAGGQSFTLTVTGSNFVRNSVVRWNGSDRATRFVNTRQLKATITAADIATAGAAQIIVVDPKTGAASRARTFRIGPGQ